MGEIDEPLGTDRDPRRATGTTALRTWWAESPRRWAPGTLWTLAWLSMMGFQPVFDPDFGTLNTAVTIAAVVVFVPFYLAVELRSGPLRRWSPLGTAVLAVLVVPFNSGASVLLVYAAGFAGSHLPRRSATRWLAGLTALLGVVVLVSTIPYPYRIAAFAPSLVLIWVIGLLTIESAENDREERARTASIERLATRSERERIARDLHDLLGQTLTGIVVRSQLAQRLVPADPDGAVAEMAEVEQVARAALEQVRATVSGFRHVGLDDEIAAARSALAAAGVEVEVRRDPVGDLAPTAETALGLALREAVTNVVRHAGARHCTVALRLVDGQVVLEVVDDGVGGAAREGNGILGMRERIAELGGDVARRTSPGSALRVTVPSVVAT